ncbi:MAG: CsbD family protein [Actinobacteria bacterium]|nr:CsbD family protein [Actinomycetota bacterium]
MNDRLLDEGRWQQVRGKIRETWGDVTDDDLDQNKGNWDQLVGKIKERTGEAGDAVEKKLQGHCVSLPAHRTKESNQLIGTGW